MKPLGNLHILTDAVLQDRYSHFDLASVAWEAGVETVQYRNKQFDWKADLNELKEIAALARESDKQLLVNDYAELALEVNASGAHVGKGDSDPGEILKRAPEGFILGVTVHNDEELEAANALNISYIGVGPVFGTFSKQTGLPPLGLESFQRFCEKSRHPVVGIGSIDAANISQVVRAGAHGAAVLSAFCLADNLAAAAKELLAAIDSAKSGADFENNEIN